MILDIVSRMLGHLGYEVSTCTDGSQAIAAFAKSKSHSETFDIVMMDLVIPNGVGGQDAVHTIKKIDPNARVIASSGHLEHPVMLDHQKFGFSARAGKALQAREAAAGHRRRPRRAARALVNDAEILRDPVILSEAEGSMRVPFSRSQISFGNAIVSATSLLRPTEKAAIKIASASASPNKIWERDDLNFLAPHRFRIKPHRCTPLRIRRRRNF